ncbi:putative WD repeat-containing protein [Ditylenchus destructor]|nr:putative WD repeat-containing protein [Ditylenchus destructor]
MLLAPRLAISKSEDDHALDDGSNKFFASSGYVLEEYCLYLDRNVEMKNSIPFLTHKKSTIYGFTEGTIEEGNRVLCCYGEKELAVYDLSTKKLYNFHFSDWIICAKLLECGQLSMLSASNQCSLYKLNCGSDTVNLTEAFSLQFAHSAVIISALMYGEKWDELSVYVGTMFGPIHEFLPATNGTSIVRTFDGHNGMVFDIRIENNRLFSVGDDRSLRVWTLSQVLNKSSTQIAEVYGHLARPLKIEFAPESGLVFTAGDDQTVCMWKWKQILGRQEELFLHYKICLYGCGSIRSLLCLGDILLVGSASGSMSSVHFHENVATANEDVSKLPQKMLNFRRISPYVYFFVDKLKTLHHYDVRTFTDTIIFNDPTMKANSMSVSGNQEFVAVSTEKGVHIIRANDLFYRNIPLETVAMSILWIENFLMVALLNGYSTMYRIDSSIGLVSCSTFTLKSNTDVRCGLLIKDELILGTRKGQLIVFSKPNTYDGGQFEWNIQTYLRAHNSESIMDLQVVNQTASIFASLGRDEWLRRWRLVKHNDSAGKILLEEISSTRLFQMPYKFISIKDKTYIASFVADSFKLVDLDNNLVQCKVYCGGGNRCWNLAAKENSEQLQLDYVYKGTFNSVYFKLFDVKHITSPLHEGQILALREYSNKSTGERFILSGGQDGRLVCAQLRKQNVHQNYESLSRIFATQQHASTIFDIDLLVISSRNIPVQEEHVIMASVGGRSELFIWHLDLKSFAFTAIFTTRILKGEQADDCRILAVRLFENQGMDGILTFVLCSDGILRCYKFVRFAKIPFTEQFSIEIDCLSMFGKLEILGESIYLTSTCGQLHVYQFEAHASTDSTCRNVSRFLVEPCGLSALSLFDLRKKKNAAHYAIVGSESGAVHVVEILVNETGIKSFSSLTAHASTVTDVQAIQCIENSDLEFMSVALDCRLIIMQYHSVKKQISIKKCILLNVADPSAILCCQEMKADSTTEIQQQIKCFIAGNGIEYVSI